MPIRNIYRQGVENVIASIKCTLLNVTDLLTLIRVQYRPNDDTSLVFYILF